MAKCRRAALQHSKLHPSIYDFIGCGRDLYAAFFSVAKGCSFTENSVKISLTKIYHKIYYKNPYDIFCQGIVMVQIVTIENIATFGERDL